MYSKGHSWNFSSGFLIIGLTDANLPKSVQLLSALSRNWPHMDTRLNQASYSPKFGSDLKNIANIVKHRKASAHSWAHRENHGSVSPASALPSGDIGNSLACQQIPKRSFRRNIFACTSGINFETVWCGLYAGVTLSRNWPQTDRWLRAPHTLRKFENTRNT